MGRRRERKRKKRKKRKLFDVHNVDALFTETMVFGALLVKVFYWHNI